MFNFKVKKTTSQLNEQIKKKTSDLVPSIVWKKKIKIHVQISLPQPYLNMFDCIFFYLGGGCVGW